MSEVVDRIAEGLMVGVEMVVGNQAGGVVADEIGGATVEVVELVDCW